MQDGPDGSPGLMSQRAKDGVERVEFGKPAGLRPHAASSTRCKSGKYHLARASPY
jgi:hypothetical protein